MQISEEPCAAQDYGVAGQPGRVTLVQVLAVDDSPYRKMPAPTAEAPPWCQRTYINPTGYCGQVDCHPAGVVAGLEACDAPDTRFPHYVSWQPDAYQIYLATSQPMDVARLIQVAASVRTGNSGAVPSG
jgi:hypothetical protein